MRRALLVLLAVTAAVLAGCGGDGGGDTASESSSASSSSSSAPATTTAPAPATTSAVPQGTPEGQFLAAMRESGIVPQLSSGPDAINLATTICVARGSGQSFADVMATLAAGSLSLDQMADLHQAATQFYCPRFFLPEP